MVLKIPATLHYETTSHFHAGRQEDETYESRQMIVNFYKK